MIFLLIVIVVVLVIAACYTYSRCSNSSVDYYKPERVIKLYISSIAADLRTAWRKMLHPGLPVVFAPSIEEADVILVVNGAETPHADYINKNKNKTIIAKMEPDDQHVEGESDYLAVWNVKNGLNGTDWFFPASYSEIAQDIPPSRVTQGDAVSVVMSSKYYFPGHKKRIDFIKYLEKYHPDIDLHIYGADNTFKFKKYKGPVDDKSDALIPYKYHFNCENSFINNYITEKFTDAILCETFNFYGGPPNTVDFYNPAAYELLDMDDFEGSALKIANGIKTDKWGTQLQEIRAVKKDVLENKSLSPRILQVLKNKSF